MTKKLEDRYKKLTHREHVLQRPETYIGSTNTELKKVFIVETIEGRYQLTQKMVHFNPGFIKIFDEVLTNASDHYIRTGKVKEIRVMVDGEAISVENDGPGIPVEIHQEHQIYIPEMIFGHLLTGENYDDTDQRAVGGRNGYGAKLCNIYSTRFIVETADGKKKYTQEFTANLSVIGTPKIEASKKNYTKITFYPDFEKFGLTEITPEIEQILMKRVLDIACYCPKVKVFYNDDELPLKSFKDYMNLYLPADVETFYEKLNGEWEVGVAASFDDSFQQVSLVNGISTYLGGTHVNYISAQIVKGIQEALEKKHKKITIKQNDIKSKLFVFLNTKVINPTFDTQTKENLTTRMTTSVVGEINVSEKFIKQILSSAIVEDIINYIEIREKAELAKLNKGKTSRVKIRKLDDANRAGTMDSEKCALFLAEGDSAAGTVLTGFASTGRDFYGCFPLKGKPLNVRGESMAKIKENDEVKNIITALGLEFGKQYTSTRELRYGKVVIMSDADCIDETTKVRTKRGDIPLMELTYEDEVLTHSGQYQKILNIISKEKKEYIRFEVKGETYKFGVNHKLMVFREGSVQEILAHELQPTDFLLLKKKNMTSVL